MLLPQGQFVGGRDGFLGVKSHYIDSEGHIFNILISELVSALISTLGNTETPPPHICKVRIKVISLLMDYLMKEKEDKKNEILLIKVNANE